MISTILLVILVLLLIGALPTWQWHQYGWGPAGVVSVLLIMLIVLLLTGRI